MKNLSIITGFFLLLNVSALTLGADITDNQEDNHENSWEDSWSDDWQEKPDSPWQISGFTDFGVGGFTKNNIVNSDQSLLELRSQLSINRYFGNTFFSSKTEIIADDIDSDHLRLEIREFYLNNNFGEHWNTRVGQQVLTWGTGDFIFLNDFFPKNWQSMFSGRDDDYLKAPSASIKTTFYSSIINADFVITPNFTSDTYITGERFSYFNPGSRTTVAAPPKLKTEEPDNNTSNSQYFLRLFKTHYSIEYAAYFYRGLYTQPLGFSVLSGKNTFPRLNSFGASLRSPILGGIGNLEFAYWDSVDDKKGDNPFIPNSQIQWLTGFEREALRNFTIGMQLLVRKIQHHDNEIINAFNTDYVADEWQKLITLRLTYLTLQQKLTSSLFIFHSPNDDDYFIKPKISYRFNDHWLYVVGANIFTGKEDHTQWGQFEKNTNIFGRVKYTF